MVSRRDYGSQVVHPHKITMNQRQILDRCQGRAQGPVSKGGADREKNLDSMAMLDRRRRKTTSCVIKRFLFFWILFIDSICAATGFFSGQIHNRKYGSRKNLGGRSTHRPVLLSIDFDQRLEITGDLMCSVMGKVFPIGKKHVFLRLWPC